MAFDVVMPERLFKPEHIVRFCSAAKTLAGGQVPFAVAVNGQGDVRPDGLTHGGQAAQVALDAGADLDLDAGEALLHRTHCTGHQLIVRDAEPADVGVVGPYLVANLPAQHFPQGLSRRFGLEVPQRHINGRMRQGGDAGAAHPLQRRVARQFLPQTRDVSAVFTNQERGMAGFNAAGDQVVAGQVRVCAGKTVARQAVFGIDLRAHHTPMRNAVRAVGNLRAGHRHMQDEGFDGFDFHGRPCRVERLQALVVLRTMASARKCRSGRSSRPRPGLSPRLSMPFLTTGNSVTNSLYQPV